MIILYKKIKGMINPKFKLVVTSEVDQRPDQGFISNDKFSFIHGVVNIQVFIVLQLLFLTFPNILWMLFWYSIFSKSNVQKLYGSDTKVYNLKHIYFPGLGWVGDWYRKSMSLFLVSLNTINYSIGWVKY